MPIKPSVHIHGKRGEQMKRLLGRRDFIVTNALPVRASVPNHADVEVYLLDVDTLTEAEFDKLARHFARKFGSPLSDVRREMRDCGVPILAEDCTVAIDMRLVT